VKYTKDKIYDLLPAVYRQNDIQNGRPLKALLNIIAEQAEILEANIEDLYGNWFIETCSEQFVSYIGDLFQAKIAYPVSSATYSQRAWVANTIGYRRRKGTLTVLEQLAHDATGWDAKAVEFFSLLITTQYLNHLRLTNICTPDIRDTERLDRITSAFNDIANTVDVRNISSKRGHYNIPNIGIFVWRLQSLPLYNAPAFDHGEGRFSFNPLGYDEPLFTHAKLEKDSSGFVKEINLSAPIRMWKMSRSLSEYYSGADDDDDDHEAAATATTAGKDQKSIQIRVNDSARSTEDILVCNLANWSHRPPPGKIALDPSLGRILFPNGELPVSVHATHFYGFSSKIGGGSYKRPESAYNFIEIDGAKMYRVSKNITSSSPGDGSIIHLDIHTAFAQWASDGKNNAVFEIVDSEYYDDEGSLEIDIPSKVKIIIRSKQEHMPIIRLPSPLKIKGGKDSVIVFDGLLFDIAQTESGDNNNYNNLLKILPGDLASLTLRHCTLVPGRNKDNNYYDSKFLFNWNGIPDNSDEVTRLRNFLVQNFDTLRWVNDPDTSFESISEKIVKVSKPAMSQYVTILLTATNTAELQINSEEDGEGKSLPKRIYDFSVHEIGGELKVFNPKISVLMVAGGTNDNLDIFLDSTICGKIAIFESEAKVKLIDSIIDGKGSSNNALTCHTARIENSTIFGGSVELFNLELASNVMFTEKVMVMLTQKGCVRFCYIPEGSHTPRRYRCQPESFNATKHSRTNGDDEEEMTLNLIPRFTSIIFGDPGYAQLHTSVAEPIWDGADNGSEIGVFNHLYQIQRIKNLRSSLDEYLRFGLEAGIFPVT